LQVFFLNEKLSARKLISIALGILGVVIILKPSVAIVNQGSLIVLGAAVCYAISHTSTKSLSFTEHPLTIIFLMCLIQLPVGLSLSLLNWKNPTYIQWLWIISIGITALSAHYCMTKAMQYAEVTMVVTMDFLRLPVIATIGVALYSESFEITLIVGASIMLLGNLLNMQAPKGKAVSTKI